MLEEPGVSGRRWGEGTQPDQHCWFWLSAHSRAMDNPVQFITTGCMDKASECGSMGRRTVTVRMDLQSQGSGMRAH